jgi:hypothetical protein
VTAGNHFDLDVSNSASPFFIVGSERSGTTLLMAILGHHSHLAVPEVTWYYPRFRAFLDTYGDLSQPANFRTLLSEMIFGLKTPFFGLGLNPATIVDELLTKIPAPNFAEAFRAILQLYSDSLKKPRWGEKTPHNLYYLSEILADFPAAKIINLVRDGRDVATEQLRSAFGPRNIYAASLIWRRTQEVAEIWRQKLPADTWLDVRYEELAVQPEPVLERVCEFLGEKYEAGILNFYQGTIARRRAKTKDHRPLGHAVSTHYVGIYQRYLSLYEQGIFSWVAGDASKTSGYEIAVAPQPVSDEEAALFLELDGRIRAATLDAPAGHIVFESYNDWLIDQREERRRNGIWSTKNRRTQEPLLGWDEEFFAGQRAARKWKTYFAVKRRYDATELVL